jgi:hypothetical protein
LGWRRTASPLPGRMQPPLQFFSADIVMVSMNGGGLLLFLSKNLIILYNFISFVKQVHE